MAQIHEYPVSIEWQGGRDGSGKVSGRGFSSGLSVPAEFGGPGVGTNPEEMLAAAVAACFSITFGIIAANRKLPLVDLKTDAIGHVEQNGASFVYTHILVKPTITLAGDATAEHETMAVDMAHKADLYCIITNAVRDKVKIEIEPTVVLA